ncbi:hypothetical protein BKA70DRAFT_1184724 [Coprinopsis sp. MPI-PUGE-AT-0042]|nr:hypothetical protein BKA70DRAFT_1184724 [Coprinopsis sp. MPI-PUGE-AT-0042]
MSSSTSSQTPNWSINTNPVATGTNVFDPIFTQPPSPALPPKRDPVFVRGEDGVSWYTNTTINDFSPLVTYSTQPHEWIIHRTYENMNASELNPDTTPFIPFGLDRFLGTYHYTQSEGATAMIEFWGSEIRLYGDGGPEYGSYSLTLDGGEPTIHTQHSLAQPIGRDLRMHTLTNLTEGRHELVITALGIRDGLTDGRALLFDYALVSQKVGEASGDSPPQKVDVEAEDLTRLTTNGTWALNTLPDDVPPLDGGAKPEIYIERKAFWTNENWATVTYNFQGSAIQVFGGWNGTHGAYHATLTTGNATNTSTIVHSRIYNATAGCDFDANEDQEALRCKWKGSTLKYSVANLEPGANYQLTLQNLYQGEGHVFEVDLIRVIGARLSAQPPDADNQEGEIGQGYRNNSVIWTNVYVLFLAFLALRRVFRS